MIERGVLRMGTITVTGAIVIITGWFSLVEYDSFSEQKQKQILQQIKRSPAYILLIALMPVGIFVNVLGGIFGFLWMIIIGATFIFLQGIIISHRFWKRKLWKSSLLCVFMLALGILMYIFYYISEKKIFDMFYFICFYCSFAYFYLYTFVYINL